MIYSIQINKTNEEHVNEVIDRLDLNMQELIEK